MSYVIPTNELTLTDIRAFRGAAIEAGIVRALALGLARSREELVVREANPNPDFFDGVSGYLINYYVTRAAFPAVAGAWALVFNAAVLTAPLLARTHVVVFYKIADADADPQVTGVRFRVGPTGATTKASFFIQLPIDNKLESEVYLSEPVVYDPEDILFVEWCARIATPDPEELSFGAFIVERTGATVS